MNSKQIIQSLIEKRKLEAIKKQIGHKLTLIARNLGGQVVSSGYRQRNPDFWRTENDFFVEDEFNDIQSINEDDDYFENELGWHFSGLKFGVNLEILLLASPDETNTLHATELKATYNGYVIYCEIESRIKCYAPFPEWETPMENLYLGVIDLEKIRKEKDKKEKVKLIKNKVSSAWKIAKMLWGG